MVLGNDEDPPPQKIITSIQETPIMYSLLATVFMNLNNFTKNYTSLVAR